MAASPNYMANDTINPSVIVSMDTIDFKVKTTTDDTTKVVGISQDGTRYPQGLIGTGSTSYAALPGQTLRVHGIGEECLLKSSTTINVGNQIKSDSIGRGTPVLGTETYTVTSVGVALESTTGANQLFRIVVEPMQINHPLA